MPDVDPLHTGTGASDPTDSLLDDIGNGDAQDDGLGISDAVDTTIDGALPGSGETVYVDVNQQREFTIDPQTGDEVPINPSDLSGSERVEIVDDHQDSTYDDELVVGDPDLTTPGDDLVADDDLSGAEGDDYLL
jgi:hypothetical protein